MFYNGKDYNPSACAHTIFAFSMPFSSSLELPSKDETWTHVTETNKQTKFQYQEIKFGVRHIKEDIFLEIS